MPELAPYYVDDRDDRREPSDAEIRRRVADLARTHVNVAHICRKLDLPWHVVARIVEQADEAEFRRVRSSPDGEKGRQCRILDIVVEKVFAAAESNRVVRDEYGRPKYAPVLDDEGAPVLREDGTPLRRVARMPLNAKQLRTAMEAMAYKRKILGLDAPTETRNLDLNLHAVVDAAETRRALADPVMQELMLKMEARQRELSHEA